jgi:hypothetical protein
MFRFVSAALLSFAFLLAAVAQEPAPQSRPVPASYTFINLKEAKSALEAFARRLDLEPQASGYIIVYGGRRSCANEQKNLGRLLLEYASGERRIDAQRLVTVEGGFRDETAFELIIVAPGEAEPKATPAVDRKDVEILQGGHPQCKEIYDASRKLGRT